MPVDRRTKYRDEEVAAHGKERRNQLQKIYEKNTNRISYLIYHRSFLTALLIGTNLKGWPFSVWVNLLGAIPSYSYLGKAKPKKTKKNQPVSVGVQADGDVAVSRLDASVQTDPYEPRLDHQTECLSMRPLALIIIIFWFSRPLNLFRCWTNPWWTSSFLVISPVISGRTIRDLHARAEEREKTLNALAYELKKVMVENRKWAELAQQNLLKMGSQLGWEKRVRSVTDGKWVLTCSWQYLSDSFHQLWMYCCFSRARLYGVRGGSTG